MIKQSNAIRTLIVDDSEDECLLLHLELRHIASIKLIGFVHDGVEAVAYLTGTERFRNREMFPYPDLMLLDYRMPRCDGMEVLAQLHHQFHRPRIVLWSDTIERNVVLSERVFIGDNNHTFSHPDVPIVQQPNKPGEPVVIGQGSWIAVGAAILAGTRLGRNCVVGANSVCRGEEFPSHAVIGPEPARLLYRRSTTDAV